MLRLKPAFLPKGVHFAIITIFVLFCSSLPIIYFFWPAVWVPTQFSSWQCTDSSLSTFDSAVCKGSAVPLEPNSTTFSLPQLNRLNHELWVSVTINHLKLSPALIAQNVTALPSSPVLTWHLQIYGVEEEGDDVELTLLYDGSQTNTMSCTSSGTAEWSCKSVVLTHYAFFDTQSFRMTVGLVNDKSTAASLLSIGQMEVDHEVLYGSKGNFLALQLTRIVLLAITVPFIVFFFYGMFRQVRRHGGVEEDIVGRNQQKWIMSLLIGLLLYNNPWYWLSLVMDNWFPSFLDDLMMSACIGQLLLFWIVIFDREQKHQDFIKFLGQIISKVLLVLCCALILVVLLTWSRIYQSTSDTPYGVTRLSAYLFLATVLLGMFVVYAVWAVYLIVTSMMKEPSTRYHGFFTLVCMIAVVVAYGFALLGRYDYFSRFLVTTVSFYIYIVGFMFYPWSSTVWKQTPDAASGPALELATEDPSKSELDDDKVVLN